MRTKAPALLAVMVVSACDGGGGGPADSDAGDIVEVLDSSGEVSDEATDDGPGESDCISDGECDDTDPCTVDTCSEYGTCLHATVDADGDGYPARSVGGRACGGTDCDDGDLAVHPDATLDCVSNHDFDCDGRPDRDEDADGHVTVACGGDDCDDDSALAFPGSLAVECTADDNDCNGKEDEDNDGDGDSREECGGGDCDDSDANVSSLLDEDTCDGLDTDCDGAMSPVEDHDQDGYAVNACVAPGGEADCDDEDDDIHPGALVQCDTVDDDCSGTWADEAGADDDGDTVLDEVCGGTDCDDEDPMTHGGAVEICADWNDQDCDGVEDGLVQMTSNARLTFAAGESGYCSVAWSGSELGVAWHDERDGNFEIYFGRVAPDGTRVGTDARITSAGGESWEPSIAWSGSEYGVAWSDVRDVNYEIYFTRISGTGVEQGSDVRVTNAIWYSLSPSMAWSGSQYGIAWVDSRDGNNEIYFARMSASGAKQGADTRITNASGDSTVPSIAWSGSEYGVSWYDSRETDTEIYFARISAGGAKLGSDVKVTGYMRASEAPSIVWTGSEYGIAWSDARDLNPEIYFVRLSGAGVEVGLETRITFSTGDSMVPALAWTGSEYVVAWHDIRDANNEVYFASFSATGLKSGLDKRLTTADGDSVHPAIAWTGSELGLLWHDARDGNYEVYFDRISYCE